MGTGGTGRHGRQKRLGAVHGTGQEHACHLVHEDGEGRARVRVNQLDGVVSLARFNGAQVAGERLTGGGWAREAEESRGQIGRAGAEECAQRPRSRESEAGEGGGALPTP